MSSTGEQVAAHQALGPARRVAFALGDFTVNTALSSLSLVYATYFLTQVAGLRPVLAGLVPFVGRAVDAFTDPLMGRLSDRFTIRGERRRPWFLIGAAPFGVSFALLWVDPGAHGQVLEAAYFALLYCALSIASTVVSIPYMALIPEMATGYDDRTSLNTYRAVGSSLGIFAAVAVRPLAEAFGGGASGFASAGAFYGALLALPWLAVWAVTFERPDFAARPVHMPIIVGLRTAIRHRTFARLTALFLMGRIAMDLLAAMLILYFTYCLGRSEDFELGMLASLTAALVALPLWLQLARRLDKDTVFILGALLWMAIQIALSLATPEWPSAALLGLMCVAGAGFAAVDLMPWAMLGEVIDEDDLATGERREGLYNGLFLFLRKLAGAAAVLLALGLLDLAGFVQGEEQPEAVRRIILLLTTLVPAACLALGIWFARGYPLTRDRHLEIIDQLRRRAAGRRVE